MITGDHKITATATAKSLGILTTGDRALTVIGLSFGVLALSELFKLFTRKKRTGCEYIRYNTSGKGVSTDAFAVTYKT